MAKSEDDIKTGTAEFNTVKAGCGIRFDPDTLSEEAGFDFSQAEELVNESAKDQQLDDEINNIETSHHTK